MTFTLKNILLILNLLLVILLGGYILYDKTQHRSGYILNQEVFNRFKGKEELEVKLNNLRTSNQQQSDSLLSMMRSTSNQEQLLLMEDQLNQLRATESQLAEQYSSDIWKRINALIIEFGKDHDYDYIFGAAGNGALMYAKDQQNLTDEVVEYLNKKYDGE